MHVPPFLRYISTTLASESCSLTDSFNSTTPVPGPPSHSCSQFTFSPLVFSIVPHALVMGSVLTLPHLGSHTAQQGRRQGGRGGAAQVSMEAAPWLQGEHRDLWYSCSLPELSCLKCLTKTPAHGTDCPASEGRRGRWVGGKRSTKSLYTYMHNPRTQTIGWWRPGVGGGAGLEGINGGKRVHMSYFQQ